MKKGRFCQSWTFSPKFHYKVRPRGDALGTPTYRIQFYVARSKSSVLFTSVFKIFLSIITPKAHARALAPPWPSWAKCTLVSAPGVQVGALCPALSRSSRLPAHCGQAGMRGGLGEISYSVFSLTALELDKNRVVETAPFSFRTLLGVLGIEATLESLIKSLCTEEN